ncbi:Oxygen regulatory protein NreC [Posidoniimonas polymericola]|uniref:Oxygen regulatory protein NreC n=1 Tax=Posidoniimonas polymericola TaxID=2528002 RepID=A0A5C5YSZ1_9BACT|nr:response regulator transcription factor [Posidoniimonas polymericola]TWT77890.1 Oxygen regulatory protein NreC [Posidoniimonas polymericola]
MEVDSRPCRVFVVEDHPLVRLGLEQSISKHSDLELVGDADNAAEAWRGISEREPNAVIVDLTLSGGDGLALVQRIATHRPAIGIVVSSMHDQGVYESRALRAGAHAYVTKDRPIEELLERVVAAALQAVEGRREAVAECGGESADPDTAEFTNRELEVFRLIGVGLTTKQIAARLQRSVKTVESFKGRLKQKLRLASGDELTREAVQWALLKKVV